MQGDDPLREFAGYAMKRAFNSVQADLNAVLTRFELRMITFSILSVVAANRGLSQSQVAAILDIERPNLVLLLDELEGRGLLSRGRSLEDRRTVALVATAKGTRLREKAARAVRDHEARMTAGLSAAQLQSLLAMLRRIESNGRSADEPVEISRA